MKKIFWIVTLWVFAGIFYGGGDSPALLLAKEAPNAPGEISSRPKGAEPEFMPEKVSTTEHSMKINDRLLNYTATAGWMHLKDDAGKPKAAIFFISYMKTGEDPGKRPITFAFNGGPGASSIWLHLGALGPKRVPLADVGAKMRPPYRLIANECTLLGFTDLVLIDPVGTGYSRAAPEVEAKSFYGVKGDIQSVGEFIRLYTTRYNRWASPKFIAGESYGTTRAAGLSNFLQDTVGMNLSGLILISAVLNFQTLQFEPGNDLPYILYLPPYTAAAWYHKKLASPLQADLRKTLKEAEEFAVTDYLAALTKGDALSPADRQRITERLSDYTGLSKEFLRESKLRVNSQRFAKELLRMEGRTIGIIDSRFTGMDRDSAGEYPEFDPSIQTTVGPFVAALMDYLRNELKLECDLPYEYLSMKANESWDWGSAGKGYVNVAEPLRQAMNKNPQMKVFIGSGLFDLDTSYFATQYTVNHLSLDSPLRANISFGDYEAGHQMYVHIPSLRKLQEDVEAFMKKTLLGSSP
jgi:carboxypeptidase C (cathepsin A)